MRVGSWIKYDPLAVALGQLGYFVNESPFVVGLEKIEFHIWELRFQSACDVIQSASSIDLGIALSKAIEIGSIQYGYSFHDWRIYRLLESIARIFVAGATAGNRSQ